MSSNEDLTTWGLGLWILPLLPDKIPGEIIDTGKRPRTIDATNTKQIVDFYKIKPLYINLPLQSGIPIKFFIAYSDDILREEVTEPSIVGKFCKFKSEYSSEVSSNGEIVDPQATEIEIITREEAQTIHNEIRESIGDELIQQINRLKNETEEENQLVQKRQQELDRAYKFFLINYFSLSKLDLILQVLNSTYQDYKKLKMSYTKLAPYVPLLKVSQENKHTYQSQAWDLPENFGNEWESKLGNNGLYVTKQIANSYLVSIFSALYLGRLVLLNGTVGVGKTSIIKHSATILGGKSNIIPVRPAWLDPTDLLGFYDPLQEIFRPAPFLSSLNEARKTENILHLICLDELNLAKIENYAADVLSQLEYSRTNKDNDSGLILYSQDLWENLRNECKYLYEKKENLDFKNQQRLKILRNLFYNYPSYQFTIPRNLVLLGTLNSDETTYDLSPKLIDRSFIITYPPASLDNLTFATPQQPSQDSQSVEHQYLSTQSIIDKINNTQEEVFKKEQALANWKKLLSWNQEYFCKYQLGRPLGYRLGKDYQVFTTVALSLGFSEEESFAYFIFTKILPRIYFFKEDEKSNQFQSWFKELEIYRDYDLGNILDNLQKQLENQQIQLVRYGG